MGPGSLLAATEFEVEVEELFSPAAAAAAAAFPAEVEQLSPPPPPAPSPPAPASAPSPPLNHACAWLISVTDAMGTPRTDFSRRQIEASTGSPGSHAFRISSTRAERASSSMGVSGYSPSSAPLSSWEVSTQEEHAGPCCCCRG